MIFRPELVRKIAAGKKTQTRRPVKAGEAQCRYRPGRDYAVQPGRGKPARFRIQVLAVKSTTLGAITFEEAKAEGFRTRDEFLDYWRELYGDVDEDQMVWAIAFVRIGDTPRLMAARAGQGEMDPDGNRDYTHNARGAMPGYVSRDGEGSESFEDEPEPVPSGEIGKTAHDVQARAEMERIRANEAKQRKVKQLAGELKSLQSRAERTGRDISEQIGKVEEALADARKAIDGDKVAA